MKSLTSFGEKEEIIFVKKNNPLTDFFFFNPPIKPVFELFQIVG